MIAARRHCRPDAEGGFVLPAAIFLLVILAALAGFMVTLSRTTNMSGALDIQGARAYQAARAGMEWAAWQVAQTPAQPCNAAPMPPLTGTLAAFTVTVSCTPSGPYADGATSVMVYQVTSTAESGLYGSVDFVSRQIEGSFSK
jgi:MSHA biogenesis protein MshP